MRSYSLTTNRQQLNGRLIEKTSNQGGSVMIEFILVAPLMLFILGYSLRLTQLLQAHQIAMMVSRETATEAFRSCTDITILALTCTPATTEVCVNTTQTISATQNCVDRVQRIAQERWNAVRPAANRQGPEIDVINVEVYRFGLSSFPSSLNCSGTLAPEVATRVSTNLAGLDNPFSSDESLQSLCRRNRAARAHISFTLNPVSSFLNLIPGFTDSTFTIVDDTLI